MFKRAERRSARLRMGLSGPPGSGKTYSALLIGLGLAEPDGSVYVIDTERGSSELYAHLGEFYVYHLTPPYSPRKYMEALDAAEREGALVIIVDTLSHAWSGEGGILDLHDQAASKMKGNTFTAWREVTPLHNQLVDRLLQSSAHVIATFRAKMEYLVEEGGKKVTKLGLAPVQRDGIEYEFTVFAEVTPTHRIVVSKDRTGLLQDQAFVATRETGRMLREWFEKGTAIRPVSAERAVTEGEDEGKDGVSAAGEGAPVFREGEWSGVVEIASLGELRDVRGRKLRLAHTRDGRIILLDPSFEIQMGARLYVRGEQKYSEKHGLWMVNVQEAMVNVQEAKPEKVAEAS